MGFMNQQNRFCAFLNICMVVSLCSGFWSQFYFFQKVFYSDIRNYLIADPRGSEEQGWKTVSAIRRRPPCDREFENSYIW